MDFLVTTAHRYSQSPALIFPGQVVSYREFLFHVAGTVIQLQKSGIAPGDRVAVLSENCREYVVLLLALWYRGAVAVPLSTRWPAGMIQRELRYLNCQHLVVSHRYAGLRLTFPPAIHSLSQLTETPAKEEPAPLKDAMLDFDRDATIIFTSGSSGEAKAVVHSLKNHLYSALGSNRNIPLRSGDVWLLSLPLYHVGGLAIVLRTLLAGSAIAIPGGGMELPGALLALSVTHLSLVTTQLHRLLEGATLSPQAIRRLKAVLVGGSSVPFPLIQRAVEMGLPLLTTYGNTEMASQVTTTRPGDGLDRLRTSGRLLQYRELRIAGDGEILLRGRTLCRGFYQQGQFHPACEKDGWYHSRDVGMMDDNGYLIVKGRLDNMFISGGENIQPEEIERVLETHPHIRQALVVPIDDDEFGQRPVAFLDTDSHPLPSTESLREFLESHLPRFKVPEHFLPWPEEFRISSAKINRRLARCLAQHRLS